MTPQLDMPGDEWPNHSTHEAYGYVTLVPHVVHVTHIRYHILNIISSQLIWYDVISCHVRSYHIISCHSRIYSINTDNIHAYRYSYMYIYIYIYMYFVILWYNMIYIYIYILALFCIIWHYCDYCVCYYVLFCHIAQFSESDLRCLSSFLWKPSCMASLSVWLVKSGSRCQTTMVCTCKRIILTINTNSSSPITIDENNHNNNINNAR